MNQKYIKLQNLYYEFLQDTISYYRKKVNMKKDMVTIKEIFEAMYLKEYVVRRFIRENKIVYFISRNNVYINYHYLKKLCISMN